MGVLRAIRIAKAGARDVVPHLFSYPNEAMELGVPVKIPGGGPARRKSYFRNHP